ncbi:MAG: HAD family hydrolase [Nanobdellota archaeon]
MNKKKHVVLDFDGVLTEPHTFFFNYFKSLTTHFNKEFPFSSPDELANNYSEPLNNFFNYLGFSSEQKDDISEFYKQYTVVPEIVPGFKQILENITICGGKIAIASNNHSDKIKHFLAKNDIAQYVVGLATPDNSFSDAKPSQDVIYKSFKHLESLFGEPESRYSVFDSRHDVVATAGAEQSLNAPITYIASTWGMDKDFSSIPVPSSTTAPNVLEVNNLLQLQDYLLKD